MTQTLESPTSAPKAFQPGSFALRDAWFPLVFTSQIRRRPVRRVVHGEPVIFYRDRAGNVQAADIPPGTPARRHPASEFTDSTGHYPLIERYGYAWVWYGNPDNASPDVLPCIPHTPLRGCHACSRQRWSTTAPTSWCVKTS